MSTPEIGLEAEPLMTIVQQLPNSLRESPGVATETDFVDIWQTYQAALARLIVRPLIYNPNDIDDMVQTTALKAFEKLATHDPESSIRAWLFQIARYTTIDELRRRSHHADVVSPEKLSDLTSYNAEKYPRLVAANGEQDPENAFISKEACSLILTALDELGSTDQEVLRLGMAGMTKQEIGQKLGIGAGAVRMRLMRARRAFRDKYQALQQTA